MISIGTIGLIKAIESFSPNKGTKLATFAARCIEKEILMHLRSSKKTRKDVSLHDPIGTDKEILDIFKRLNEQGRTIVLITHDLAIAQQAKRVVQVSCTVLLPSLNVYILKIW